ncbi:MAG: XapX domain-containing protein [Pseudomonadota bacterium]
MKIVISIFLAMAIGAGARMTGIPAPAPPAIIGALLVLAMTLGYIAADFMAGHRSAKNRHLCGGPTGETKGYTS